MAKDYSRKVQLRLTRTQAQAVLILFGYASAGSPSDVGLNDKEFDSLPGAHRDLYEQMENMGWVDSPI